MSKSTDVEDFYFEGFEPSNTTPVPDVLFDRLLSRLGEAELKVLLYIIRRTRGFKKSHDAVSFNQFIRGITTHDGRVLDEGCGLKNKTALSKALKSLEAKGIIRSDKGRDERGENTTTVYSIRWKGSEEEGGVVRETYPQETVLQETVKQDIDHSNLRKDEKKKTDYVNLLPEDNGQAPTQSTRK